jgi:hypothetical protein
MRSFSRSSLFKTLYLGYLVLATSLAYVLYIFFFGKLGAELCIGLLGLVFAILSLVVSLHSHLSSTLRYYEVEAIAIISRDPFYREIILELTVHEPRLHSELLQRMEKRISHSNKKEFSHAFYTKLGELAIFRYVKLEPVYKEEERSWIMQASLYDKEKRDFFMKNRRLLKEIL